MKKKIKFVRQHDESDCGAACLSMICKTYRLKLPLAVVRKKTKTDINGSNILGIVQAAEELGFSCEALEGNAVDLLTAMESKEIICPFIAHIISENHFLHFVVVYGYKRGKFIIADPANGIRKVKKKRFCEHWTGKIISFRITERFAVQDMEKDKFKRYIKLLYCQKGKIAVSAILSCLIIGVSILSATFFQYLIDNAFAFKIDNILQIKKYKIFEVITIAITLQFITNIIRGGLLATIERDIDIKLKKDYFKKLLRLPISFFINRRTGDVISRFSDIGRIREVLASVTLTCILNGIMILCYSIYLIKLNTLLYINVFIVMLLYAILCFVSVNPIKNINMNVMEDNASIITFLKESIAGIDLIKAYQYESGINSKMEQNINKFGVDILKGAILYSIIDSAKEYVSEICKIGIFIFGVIFLSQNNISIGQLISFYIVTDYLVGAVKGMVETVPLVQGAVVASERLNDIFDSVDENVNEGCSLCIDVGEILMEDVCFRHGNQDLILNKLNIKIKDKECVALVGENGSGKTTIAKLLMSFYKIESGKILLGGKNIDNIFLESLRNKVAYVSQETFIFSDSIKSNLSLGKKDITIDNIENVCKLVDMHDYISKLPEKYDTILSENGTSLSAGQKQRLSIARAILKQPSILIFDEATSNLDMIAEEKIQGVINKLKGQITIVIIAHRLSLTRNCDKIFVLKNGCIIEEGMHEELIKNRNVYYDLWNKQ